jgi:hypothetical protein
MAIPQKPVQGKGGNFPLKGYYSHLSKHRASPMSKETRETNNVFHVKEAGKKSNFRQ